MDMNFHRRRLNHALYNEAEVSQFNETEIFDNKEDKLEFTTHVLANKLGKPIGKFLQMIQVRINEDDIRNKEPCVQAPLLTIPQLFYYMTTHIRPSKVESLIEQIPYCYPIKSELKESIQEKDYNKFYSTIKEHNVYLGSISHDCSYICSALIQSKKN